MKRNNCVLCDSTSLKEAISVANVPVYMGTTNSADPAIRETLVYGFCEDCQLLQLLDLIDPQILYAVNHNTQVVGKKWELHNQMLAAFIKETARSYRVLEIGDPSAKIAQLSDYLKWFIVEPKPLFNERDLENLEFIEDWLEHAQLPNNIDTILLSHVFEHLHNPKASLEIIRKALNDDGTLILSVPNLGWLLDSKGMPPGGLHFEHTFFVDLEVMVEMLSANGFTIEKTAFFNDHSIFLAAKKSEFRRPSPVEPAAQKLIDAINYYKDFVKDANSKIANLNNPKVYLYGAHFPAQFLLSLGLNVNPTAILDNATSKIGQTLYGTDLKVISPTTLNQDQNPVVICQMGPYTDEIKSQLTKINPNTLVL